MKYVRFTSGDRETRYGILEDGGIREITNPFSGEVSRLGSFYEKDGVKPSFS